MALLAFGFTAGSAFAAPEDVAYSTPDAFRVLASYYRPDTTSTRAVVIFPDPREGRGAWAAVGESLRTAGFHVLIPDLRGAGQSTLQRGIRRDRSRFTRSEAAMAGLDAEAALRYLRDLPDSRIHAFALIGSGTAVMTLSGGRGAGSERLSRIMISPALDEDAGTWEEAIRRGTGNLLVIVTSHDLPGIDVAAILVPKDGSKECWMIEGTERGPGLLLARSDLIAPLDRWIRESLSSP